MKRGTTLKTNKEKSKELLMRYLNQSYKGDRSARQKAREYIHHSTIQTAFNNGFLTIGDIKCKLRSCENTLPGPDSVRYGHIKQLTDAELLVL